MLNYVNHLERAAKGAAAKVKTGFLMKLLNQESVLQSALIGFYQRLRRLERIFAGCQL